MDTYGHSSSTVLIQITIIYRKTDGVASIQGHNEHTYHCPLFTAKPQEDSLTATTAGTALLKRCFQQHARTFVGLGNGGYLNGSAFIAIEMVK